MILEARLAKAIAAGGGLVSGAAIIAGMVGGGQYATTQAAPAQLASAVCAYTDKPSTPKISAAPEQLRLTPHQAANARVIVNTANELGLPRRAAVIGIATALQESSLDNSTVGDHGRAFGIFQQHPEYGWGTRAQVSTPRHATRTFFDRLTKIKNWTAKPLTVVAQAIQRSAFPNAYAKHESRAEGLVTALTEPNANQNARDTLELSPADTKAVRASLELATSLGVTRAAVVADVEMALQAGALRSAPKDVKSRADTARLAEKIVRTVAGQLCKELSQKIGQVLDQETLAAIRTSGRGTVALTAALKMIGVPYSWGGGGPKGPSYGIGHGAGTRGFDCSGLAEYAWAKAGVRIGGHTSTQWRSGVRVPRSQLEPGDLVFFATNPKNPSTIHPVVLNIDGKRYVHAPTTGSKVQVGQWTVSREAEFAGAVRPG
ncbi:C40 family peptidase [Nonomuraea sp. NPDC049400]|uniref:C40 family peptidase n=1 Tax=Nonomuraea sp. NPDC049400 TaxID=3364352 RepID=UPI0037B7931E